MNLTTCEPGRLTKFDGIRVGDRVRLTAGDDVAEFTVTRTYPHAEAVESERNAFAAGDWESIEILSRALPTEPGFYEASRFPLSEGSNLYALHRGSWREVTISGHIFERTTAEMARVGTLNRLG